MNTLTQKEQYELSLVANKTYNELYLPVKDEDAFQDFNGALACVFDIDPAVIGYLCNKCYLSRPPSVLKGIKLNYIQWLVNSEFDEDDEWIERDPIEEVLSVLLCSDEPHYYEKYNKSERLTSIINSHLLKSIQQHGSFLKYFEYISERLWEDKDYIARNYTCYVEIATMIENELLLCGKMTEMSLRNLYTYRPDNEMIDAT